MKELQEVRNEVLHLKNMGVINKQEETKLLHKLNALEEAISVTRCCDELPEIEDLRFRLENVDNKWYSKNEHSRTAYELGASNTFYWMRKEISK
jgi:hypothetical protein